MTAYLIVTYDISDPERFADYNPGSVREIGGTIKKHGGRTVGVGPTEATVGEIPAVCVCIEFPDVDAAKAWQDDDEYAPLKAIRYESTSNITEYIVPGI